MFLKKFIVAAVFAAGSLTASMSSAATCIVGTCDVTLAGDDFISSGVLYNIDEIGAGDFLVAGTFENDQPQDGFTVAAGLISSLGTVTDLVFRIVAPGSIAADYALTSDVKTKIALVPTEGETISWELHGKSTAGLGGALPDINLFISAVPLPAGVLLMGTALAGFGVMRRRKS